MSEEKQEKIPELESINEEQMNAAEKIAQNKAGTTTEAHTELENKEVETGEAQAKTKLELNNEKTAPVTEEVQSKNEPKSNVEQKTPKSEKVNNAVSLNPVSKKEASKTKEVQSEIDDENAEDAEDKDNKNRHSIPLLEYQDMSMEDLVSTLQRLVANEKVQAIKKHVDGIKNEFNQKFQEFIDGKKEEFIAEGGNEIDFHYNSVTKKQFNEVYSDYRDKRNQYYKGLENTLKDNLKTRLEIIEELKGLVSVEEDMGTTYNTFKTIQAKWRTAGPIPRDKYSDIWQTYQHHIEMFYDFLHLNRELRDLDFKHNLEEKNKLIARAENLAKEEDLGSAFRELQELHKIWKEEIGPVAREIRDEIWERFSNATKVLHSKRQEHQKHLEKIYEENLVAKNEIIAKINTLAENASKNHKTLQLQIKQIAELREAFFKAGKVPQKVNETVWKTFKEATRNFNHQKNAFYKNLKKEQQVNLDRKRELVARAVSLKESEEWETATQAFKRIQNDWKKIGHVPRKYSDAIWKEFKNACNHYFNRLHALKNSAQKEEEANFKKKTSELEKLKTWEPSGNQEKDIASIKEMIAAWKGYGRVPFKQKHIDQKFSKVLDALFKKIGMDKQESELLRYGNKIQQLASSQDQVRALGNERQFIRKKIGESKTEILQLENNLQFFKHTAEDNPMVKDVRKNIERHRTSLETWQGKLKKLNIMENNLNKIVEDSEVKPKGEEE